MPLLPRDIFAFLSTRVLGQDDVLQKIAVALYKHINGLGTGNILLIGNSGTGKTTVMKAIRALYAEHESLSDFRATTILNANILQGEQAGDVDTARIFHNLETAVRTRLGTDISRETLRTHMERATVCIDEVDKIASKILGKVNAAGIGIQHALLTILEGETVSFDPARGQERILLDTSHMLFICAGAFEELYDTVFKLISEHKDERRFHERLGTGSNGQVTYTVDFNLKDYLKLQDLFDYGMAPQFLSRFSAVSVLEDLGKNDLQQILLTAPDSPLTAAHTYFKAMGFDFELTPQARTFIITQASQQKRIGARSLREVLGRVIASLEFDPAHAPCLQEADGKKRLVVDESFVRSHFEQGH